MIRASIQAITVKTVIMTERAKKKSVLLFLNVECFPKYTSRISKAIVIVTARKFSKAYHIANERKIISYKAFFILKE